MSIFTFIKNKLLKSSLNYSSFINLKSPYICPYCQKELPFIPKAARKCPNCSQKFYIKYSPSNRQKRLITKDEGDKIKQEWSEYYEKQELENFYNDILDKYSDYIIESEIKELKKNLLPHGFSKYDIKWRIYNDLIIKIVQNPKSYNVYSNLADLYYDMARMIVDEGKKDSTPYFKLYQEMRLREMQQNEISKVQIITCNDELRCPECAKLENKIYTIDQALEEMPLPCKKCGNLNDKDPSGVVCRCRYVPIVD